MTDTTAPMKPKWQLILGLLPSLNTALVAIVTATLSIGGTLVSQRYTVVPRAPEPVPTPKVATGPDPVITRVNALAIEAAKTDSKIDELTQLVQALAEKKPEPAPVVRRVSKPAPARTP